MILAFGVVPLVHARIVGGAEAAQAVRLASGKFGGSIDAIHRAEGNASVYQLSNGVRVVRLENFKSTNGPNLDVYLSGDPSPRNSCATARERGLRGRQAEREYRQPEL
jgi:hypothetical protein